MASNPLVELYRIEYLNDPFVIAQNDRMVAINSALEVDLTGRDARTASGRERIRLPAAK